MPNITLALSREVHEEMKKHQEIRWSEVARQSITGKLEELREFDRLKDKEQWTDEDITSFSKIIKKRAHKRLMNAHNSRHKHNVLSSTKEFSNKKTTKK